MQGTYFNWGEKKNQPAFSALTATTSRTKGSFCGGRETTSCYIWARMVDTGWKDQRLGEILPCFFPYFSYNFSSSREQGHKDKFILNKTVVTFIVNCPRAPRPWSRLENSLQLGSLPLAKPVMSHKGRGKIICPWNTTVHIQSHFFQH